MFATYGRAPHFVKAKPSGLLIRHSHVIAWALSFLRKGLQVEVSADDLGRLKALRDRRCILAANHPTPGDWATLCLLSRMAGLDLHYMTAHEQFAGAREFWLPRFAAYSVRRGGWGDIGCAKETLRLLACQRVSLAMFPEGRCSFMSRRLMDFKAGAARLGLTFLSALQHAPDLFVVPTTLRYEYLEPIEWRLQETIGVLERRLDLLPRGGINARLQALAERIVEQLEDQHELGRGEQPWCARIETLCRAVLARLEAVLQILRPPRSSIIDRACNIRQVLSLRGHQFGIRRKKDYEKAYFPTLLALLLETLSAWDMTADHSETEQADLLSILERIVHRVPDPPPHGARRVVVAVGEPVNLKDWLDDYRACRSATAQNVTGIIRSDIQTKLARGTHASTESAASGWLEKKTRPSVVELPR